MDFNKLLEIETCKQTFNPWKSHHKIFLAETWKNHSASVSMFDRDVHVTPHDLISFVINEIYRSIYRGFKIWNHDAAVYVKSVPEIGRTVIVNDKIKFTQSYKGTLIAHLA